MSDVVPRAGGVYRSAAGVAFGLMSLQRWRFDVAGLEHVPASGGAVIAANHTSFWDFFTVGRAPYIERGRPVRILAKASLFRVPVFGWLMRRAEHIPVRRGAGGGALAAAVAALRAGELVLVLPEQTISPSFELLPFKDGAARMAADAGVPLIPAASWGSHRFHTVGQPARWSWKLPVVVKYGPALHPAPDEDTAAVTAALRSRVAALLTAAQRRYPDDGAGRWWQPARLGGTAPPHDEALKVLAEHRSRWRHRRAG